MIGTKQVITNSRRTVFRRCQREHHYSFDLRIRARRTAGALSFGSMFHAGLEAWWRWFEPAGPRSSTALDVALSAAQQSFAEQPPETELSEFDLVKVEEMLAGYDARWSAEMPRFEVLHVEAEFRAPLINPRTGRRSPVWEQGGKLDAIARERDTGRVWIVEHKTTSSSLTAGGDYWLRLRIDPQVSTYFDGAAALGVPAFGCLYDVAHKPAQKRLLATPDADRKYTKATASEPARLYKGQREQDETLDEYRARVRLAIGEDPERYFARGEVVRLESDLIEHHGDVWMTAKAIREGALENCFPRNPDACSRYGRFCDYFDVCTGVAQLDDEERFIKLRVNPELAALAATEESR